MMAAVKLPAKRVGVVADEADGPVDDREDVLHTSDCGLRWQ